MTETLFPKRQRCKGCSKSLGKTVQDPVLFGLYCSPKCAGIAAPATRVEDAPRECRRTIDDVWHFKRRYRSVEEIPTGLRSDPSTSSYACRHCGHLHIGRTLVATERAQNRGLRDRADLADLLGKARGGATIKQVGAVLQVRPIRIKECEDPSFDAPSLTILFALCALYRIDLAAVFRRSSS